MINKFHVVSSKVAVLDVSFTTPPLAFDVVKWRQEKVLYSFVDEKHTKRSDLIQKLDCILNSIIVVIGHKAAKVYQPENWGSWLQSIVDQLLNLRRFYSLDVSGKRLE